MFVAVFSSGKCMVPKMQAFMLQPHVMECIFMCLSSIGLMHMSHVRHIGYVHVHYHSVHPIPNFLQQLQTLRLHWSRHTLLQYCWCLGIVAMISDSTFKDGSGRYIFCADKDRAFTSPTSTEYLAQHGYLRQRIRRMPWKSRSALSLQQQYRDSSQKSTLKDGKL